MGQLQMLYIIKYETTQWMSRATGALASKETCLIPYGLLSHQQPCARLSFVLAHLAVFSLDLSGGCTFYSLTLLAQQDTKVAYFMTNFMVISTVN